MGRRQIRSGRETCRSGEGGPKAEGRDSESPSAIDIGAWVVGGWTAAVSCGAAERASAGVAVGFGHDIAGPGAQQTPIAARSGGAESAAAQQQAQTGTDCATNTTTAIATSRARRWNFTIGFDFLERSA